jgi:hypothetical protein
MLLITQVTVVYELRSRRVEYGQQAETHLLLNLKGIVVVGADDQLHEVILMLD